MQAKSFLKQLTIIHAALVIGLLLFAAFVFWNDPSFNTGMNAASIFVYLVPLVAAVGYFASKYLFKNLLQNKYHQETLANSLAKYQQASIIKFALIEGPAIFALFAYYVEGNALHLVIAFCLIAYLISQRPSLGRMQNDLQLKREQLQE